MPTIVTDESTLNQYLQSILGGSGLNNTAINVSYASEYIEGLIGAALSIDPTIQTSISISGDHSFNVNLIVLHKQLKHYP